MIEWCCIKNIQQLVSAFGSTLRTGQYRDLAHAVLLTVLVRMTLRARPRYPALLPQGGLRRRGAFDAERDRSNEASRHCL